MFSLTFCNAFDCLKYDLNPVWRAYNNFSDSIEQKVTLRKSEFKMNQRKTRKEKKRKDKNEIK